MLKFLFTNSQSSYRISWRLSWPFCPGVLQTSCEIRTIFQCTVRINFGWFCRCLRLRFTNLISSYSEARIPPSQMFLVHSANIRNEVNQVAPISMPLQGGHKVVLDGYNLMLSSGSWVLVGYDKPRVDKHLFHFLVHTVSSVLINNLFVHLFIPFC